MDTSIEQFARNLFRKFTVLVNDQDEIQWIRNNDLGTYFSAGSAYKVREKKLWYHGREAEADIVHEGELKADDNPQVSVDTDTAKLLIETFTAALRTLNATPAGREVIEAMKKALEEV